MKIIDNYENKLYLGASKIATAGVGLFTGIDIPSGIPVCEYKGETLNLEDEEGSARMLKKYEYTLSLGFKQPKALYGLSHAPSGMTIDCQPALTEETTGLGGYVNDAAGWQVRMTEEYTEKVKEIKKLKEESDPETESTWQKFNLDLGYNLTYWPVPSEIKVLLLSIRSIKAGEELYVDYGNRYWRPFIEKIIEDQKVKEQDEPSESVNKNEEVTA